MKKLSVLLVVLMIVSTMMFSVKTIKMVAWTVGPDDPSINRKVNLEKAAERLNKMLETAGSDIRIDLEVSFDSTDWGSYKQRALIAFQSGKQQIDIITSGHDDIGMWAAAKYIIPIDSYVQKFWDLGLYDIIPSLWESTKFKGKIYGIPQDTEARPLYARRDKLREMGYTDAQIDDMMNKFNTGEYTLYDLVRIAQEGIEMGVVKWGLWHRPSKGIDYFQIFTSFGAQIYDQATNKLVFDEVNMRKAFQFFYDISNKYKITPKTLIGTPWNSVHSSFAGPEGNVLFHMGGTWNVAEWKKMFGYTNEDIKEKFAFSLTPSAYKGKPGNTLSHPVVYMVTSRSKYPELATLLITLASAADLNAKHAIDSGHLAIRFEEMSNQYYAKDEFTKKVTALLPYTSFIPNNDRFDEYNKAIFDAITALEAGRFTPDQAIRFVEMTLKSRLKDDVIIKK
ncbi:carbohydrate ABC transporter substrate-binding protein, CUT1 family [Marinitoga hydrogenitolerans DSM 16785]|uniref:Carbohydrate ABC transporter substrate-binding protein, CUT1 family n=1 Tax=Marinitoga hydrogenitolerans (strain DSM 16785 / JCM 12826 / AT1271) TaxID=1122195 RepID=A0A1M4SJE1_MARH1|nr:extracellular solute-binding protein [Marinitoga hydrogenitolerans]SHE32107.1 carbohydrate ABC transporter substrate-binding protein, CUT1 family [Marinitoga hydrogenitolerans DSM 16785]